MRLVCAGQATPGQTSWQILDAMDLGTLTDFAYGLLIENRDQKQRDEVDVMLVRAAEMASQSTRVEVYRQSGEVVQISEARLAQIERNMRGMGRIGRGKKRERER